MQRRMLTVVLTATIVAVLVLGIPLAVAAQRLIVNDERSELETLALRAAASVSLEGFSGQDPVELPDAGSEIALAIYLPGGAKSIGDGPASADSATQGALRGEVVFEQIDGNEVVSVPVSVGEEVIAAARAASPVSDVRTRVGFAWLAMTLVGAAAIGLATVLTTRQTRQLSTAVHGLTDRANALAAGDIETAELVTGIGEIDRAARALDGTASRLQAMLARERAISTSASHQLRSPLTTMRLRVENALADDDQDPRDVLRDVVRLTDSLTLTIQDLVGLAREPQPQTTPIDFTAVLDQVRLAWNGPLAGLGRPLRLIDSSTNTVSGNPAALRQVLFTLLDNATRHGNGTVRLSVRDAGEAVAIDISDQGTWEHPTGNGMGLHLADELARTLAGRLVRTSDHPTTLTLYLPSASSPAAR